MYRSNCKIDYIKTCNNDNIEMKSAYLYFLMIFPYVLAFFMNIHEYANYTNMILAYLTIEWKAYVLALI